MDQEKLIEMVKSCEPLYVMSHSKYSDNTFKENAWRRIAKEMNQPATACKKTWTNLRDSFRRALKKKRETKSGQSASKIKKWKFEDEMSFLLPFMQERDTCSNLEDVSDDNNEDEPNEDEYDDTNNGREDDRNDDRRDDRNDDRRDGRRDDRNDDRRDDRNNDKDKDDNVDEELHVENEKKRKQKDINRKNITKAKNKENKCQTQPETASEVMIKYFLEKKTAKAQITPPTQQSNDSNAINTFFSSIAATVNSFSPYYQNIAKSQIFSIISDLEMKQILQEQPPNAPIQRQHSAELYHTRPHVSRPLSSISVSPSSPSLSTIPASPLTTPTVSPSYYDMSMPMPHLGEQTGYTQNTM
ncbi:uncharacterized protein [Temnothorax nylanderi]|uniref:uncharacterized protein n=1 Tax=Temnothorax nylanderi TaxID=102681 RepID=UPI003A893147